MRNKFFTILLFTIWTLLSGNAIWAQDQTPTTDDMPPLFPETIEDVPIIEEYLIDRILENDPGYRLVTDELMPGSSIIRAGITLTAGEGDTIAVSTDFPGDLIPMGGLVDVMIWRFSGSIPTDVGHVFTGEGDQLNLLTVARLPKIGLVYLRGEGHITLSDGQEIGFDTIELTGQLELIASSDNLGFDIGLSVVDSADPSDDCDTCFRLQITSTTLLDVEQNEDGEELRFGENFRYLVRATLVETTSQIEESSQDLPVLYVDSIKLVTDADSDATDADSDATDEGQNIQEATECKLTAPRNVNLRTGPGINFDRADTLLSGQDIDANGQLFGADGFAWYRLITGAWVRSDVVNEADGCSELPQVTP